MTPAKQSIYRDKSGYTYDRESGNFYDPEGQFVGNRIAKTISDKMIKLHIQKNIAFQNNNYDAMEKIEKKIRLLGIAESPFLYSTPLFCYSYVLYKLRKVADYSQEVMAFNIGMPTSTYIKIENRILTPSLKNIVMARVLFNLTAKEFAELYSSIEKFVNNQGKMLISFDMTDFNTDKVKYAPCIIDDTSRCTPIDLYDSKMLKEDFDKIDTLFRETYLVGKKRQIEIDQKIKEFEQKQLIAEQEYENLSFEEKRDLEIKENFYKIQFDDEKGEKQEERLEALQKFHGSKYNYSL